MAPHNRDREFREAEHADVYVGPQQFMEAGWRGFLVTTLARKEEFGVDDAMDLLRQASIKIHGGYKPHGVNDKRLEYQGYVKVDCLDLEKVTMLPNPETKEEEEAKTASGPKGDHDQEGEDGAEEKEDKMDEADEKAAAEGEEKKGEDGGEKKEGEEGEKKEGEEEKKEGEEGKKEGEDEKKDKRRDRRRDRDRNRNRKEPERMHSIYKFKAYRTEIRNRLFILSNVPDPMELSKAAMDLVVERSKVTGDAVNQLLPVVGVCPYDYYQLEVMCKRVLAPLFDEQQEAKCFDVLMIDTLSEPGSDMLIEVVRNSVWAINPAAYLCSSVAEPDVVLRLEVLGSKLVLSAITEFMKYRQLCPTVLVDLGTGQGEDDDGGWQGEEAKRESEANKKMREKQKALEKAREEERQKERARRHAEAKKREEERKKKKEEEKAAAGEQTEEMKKKAAEWIENRKKELSEKTEGGGEEEKGEAKTEQAPGQAETPTEKETPPTKKQKIISASGAAAKEEVVAAESSTQDDAKSTPGKSRRSSRKK